MVWNNVYPKVDSPPTFHSYEKSEQDRESSTAIEDEEKFLTKCILALLKAGIIVIDVGKIVIVKRFVPVVGVSLTLLVTWLRDILLLSKYRFERNPNNSVSSIIYQEILNAGIICKYKIGRLVQRILVFLQGLYDFANQFKSQKHTVMKVNFLLK